MNFSLQIENYLETLMEGRPKIDHSKLISLDLKDIQRYINKMSEEDLNKPIYKKILEYLMMDDSGNSVDEQSLKESNKYTLATLKNKIENHLKDNFDDINSVKFHSESFIKLFIKKRKSFSPYEETSDTEKETIKTPETEKPFDPLDLLRNNS